MANLGKIGRRLMDNWGKLGSSLIFYFVAIDDRRSTIRDKCKPKPILVWGTVPQRVNSMNQQLVTAVSSWRRYCSTKTPSR